MRVSHLIPIDMEIFVDGMIIPCDVYNSTGKSLILKKGHIMTAQIRSRFYSHNELGNGLLVSEESYQMLVDKKIVLLDATHIKDRERQKRALKNSIKQQQMEKETGFTELKDEVSQMFSKTEDMQIIHHDNAWEVSAEISNRLDTVESDLVIALINVLASVDEYLHRHSVNVSMLNGIIGKWMGLSKEVVENLITVGLTHDCGKVLVPPEVLNAPRSLSRVEFELIKMHSIHSCTLLENFPEMIRMGARAHHEKYCGGGYGDGLHRDNIPIMARITAVSDIYDAMVSRRVYKEPRSPFQIMSLLRNLSGSELDPLIVDTFINNMPKELLNKPVLLSNGETAIVSEIDPDDLEYPYVRIGEKVTKTDSTIYCTSMEL